MFYNIFKASGVSQTEARRIGLVLNPCLNAQQRLSKFWWKWREFVKRLMTWQNSRHGIHSSDSDSELNVDECPGKSGGSDALKMSLESIESA